MKTLEHITKEYLQVNFNNLQSAVDYCVEQISTLYPEKPFKPLLKNNASPVEIRLYADAIELHQLALSEYKLQMENYRTWDNHVNNVLKEYVLDLAGIEYVPEEYRNKVWKLAWENGHHSGYTEVLSQLESLVDLFIPEGKEMGLCLKA